MTARLSLPAAAAVLALLTGCAAGPSAPPATPVAAASEPAATAAPSGLPPEGDPLASPAIGPSAGTLPSELPSPPAPSPQLLPSGRLAPVVTTVRTTQPVVFLGIDDGFVRSPWLLALERRRHLPFSMFLEGNAWSQDVAYWRAMQAAGATVEDHTVTHPVLTRLSSRRVAREICSAADGEANAFGIRPVLFRPPYGSTDRRVQAAAAECGMRAVVLWDVAVNDGQVQFGPGRSHLRAGDIVLMHFRQTMQADMTAFLNQAAADHLALGRLEDYLLPAPADGSPTPSTPGSSSP